MSEAKKCDRCGELYATQEVTQIRMPIYRPQRETMIGYWDLCDDCVGAFEKFMQGGQVFDFRKDDPDDDGRFWEDYDDDGK